MTAVKTILNHFMLAKHPVTESGEQQTYKLKYIAPFSPVKIFVDAHVFDSGYQGTRSFIKGIYTALAANEGVEIYLGARNVESLAKDFPILPNLKFIEYKSTSRYRRLLSEIPGILMKNGFDYAHFQYICPPVKCCRYIVTIHDVIFHDLPGNYSRAYRWIKHFLYKRSAMQADMLTTVSDYSRNSIEDYLNIDAENIHLVANGIDPGRFNHLQKQSAKEQILCRYGIDKFILYVSRIEPRKNHIVLLDAWLELELYKKKIHLVLLGSQTLKTGSFHKKLRQLPMEIRRFIFISNTINDQELVNFYNAATLFVYPSGGEGFGIPPLEAAAVHTPVICSNKAALRDYHFFDDDHINPFDLNLLKQRITHHLDHPLSPAKLEERAEFVRKLYNWKIPAMHFYQLLTEKKSIL